MSLPSPVSAFFAYPAKPETAEVIGNCIQKINEGGVASITGWEACRVGGKLIIDRICHEIDAAALFCADLTELNHNVMFELGYAIARGKRIWLTIDDTIGTTKSDFQKLQILTTVGYQAYQNSHQLVDAFFSDQPWSDLNATVFSQVIRPQLPTAQTSTILYLKSRHQTEPSTLITKEMAAASKALGLPLIVDDPRETSVQPLQWYAVQVYNAQLVVVHLINPVREGAHLHNAKYSFVAGFVHGLEKPMLMLAQGEFLAPLDYRDILRHYQTGSEAERHLHAWLVPQLERVKSEKIPQQLYLSQVKLAQELGQLQIGEPIAEHETSRLLSEYFVETNIYRDAFDGRVAIIVGRKGAGKSANFLKLEAALGADRRNLVCVIKPITYEMQGIIELLQRYKSINLKTYAVESIWKFLIYSEVANVALHAIEERVAQQVSDNEKDLVALMDQHSEMLKGDFSVRLERCILSMLQASPGEKQTNTFESEKKAISEILHSTQLRRLREVLALALKGKKRIAILIDNLDKGWDKQSDIDTMSEFLLGLLSASGRIEQDFKNVGFERITLQTTLTVFLREDIFLRVMSIAGEPDKIARSRLTWSDDEVLIRVVEQRFSSSMNKAPAEVWGNYFVDAVRGPTAKGYFLSRILKRPRDLVFFIKAAINLAVNRRHPMVTEVDILDAEKQYSQFAIDSILVENGITISALEELLYGFLGCESELRAEQVMEIVAQAKIPAEKAQYVVDHLCSLTFLGVEVRQDEFRYSDGAAELTKNLALARQLAATRGVLCRYRIHPAFRAFLEIAEW